MAWTITSHRTRWRALPLPAPAPIGDLPTRSAAAQRCLPGWSLRHQLVWSGLHCWCAVIQQSLVHNRPRCIGDQPTANFIGQSYGARLEGGYRVATLPTFAVTPYGAVQFQDFNTPAYSETDPTGGGFGLSYGSMNATDVRTELGSRFDAPTLVYGKPLVFYGHVAWAAHQRR